MSRLNVLSDEKFLTTFFRNLARQQSIPVTLHYKGKKYTSRMLFEDKAGRQPMLQLTPEAKASVNGTPVKVAFLDRELFFLLETNLRPGDKGLHHMVKPFVIYSSFRRTLPRYRLKEGEPGTVSFLTQGTFPLIDISTEGFSFLSDRKLWTRKEAVHNITVNLDDGMEIIVDGRVRFYRREKDGSYLYGLKVNVSEWFPRYDFFRYIARKTYPNVRWMEECERDDVLELYEKSGYFSLKPQEEMQRSIDCWKATCAKLRNKRQVSANLVYDGNGKLLTAASALRIYDKTFLGHQLASLPEARLNMKSKTDVYFVMSDFLIDHLYCDHYLTYFDTHNPWHREVYTKMGAFIDDENKFIFDEMEMFEYKAGRRKSLTAQKGYTVEVPDSPAEFLGYCKKSMKPVERDCYDYDEGSFSLRKITQVYEVLDLYVVRRLWSVKKKGKIVAYAVAETYSDGLNLFNLLDMCRVYFVDGEINRKEVLQALLPQVKVFFTKYGKERFYVTLKGNGQDVKSLEFSGFQHRHSAGRVMMSRPGMIEYRTVLAMNSRR